MKELAEQAATGTYTSDQRIIIDSEYQAMASEITRIANATDFNGIYLLNGNLSGSTHNGSAMASTGKLKVHFGTANDSAEDYYYIQIGTCTASALGFFSGSATGATGQTEAEYVAEQSLTLLESDTWGNIQNGGTYNNFPNPPSGLISNSTSVNVYDIPSHSNRVIIGEATNHDILAIWLTPGPGGTWNYYSNVGYEVVGNTGSTASGSSISTQALAQQALITVKNAIISKDKIRANLGALQNRLENTISNLQIQAENLQAAESRISDVDVATEMTEFVRQQILTQAAVAMLSQANSLPRMALQLMG
jgi:flagellin